MIDDKFIKSCKKLIRKLNKLQAADSLDESVFWDIGVDLNEILGWSQYCIETLLEEVTWKNKSKSTINEIKDGLKEVRTSNAEYEELLNNAVRAIEALQWTQNNLVKVHKKEKQDLWKKAIKTMYKDAVAKHDLVMGENKYIDLKILRQIRDEQLGETK